MRPSGWKKRTAMRSEMEEAEVGWPDLVTLTALAESILI